MCQNKCDTLVRSLKPNNTGMNAVSHLRSLHNKKYY